ncbi:MAG: hypothetical protein K2H75_01335, partial [Muribaculaceae bacterium]|nr:hypothetical protein [Muribaculaceae bacterium]
RQSALGEHTLSLSPMVVALENGNLEAEVEISAPMAHGWTFEIIEGGEWMEVSKSDDKLSIEADVLQIPYRTGRINIISAGNRLPVYVVQGDFRQVNTSLLSVYYFGQLNDMPYTSALINVQGDKYASPYVGQEYQDYVNIQINTQPMQSFGEFRLCEGIYPILMENDGVTAYCSSGFFDDDMGVYGSCWLRRWFYMGEDYGFNGLFIFREGNIYITVEDNTASVYITATGVDQNLEAQTYVMKLTGNVNYIDNTVRSGSNHNSLKGVLHHL